ncbi:MAG: VOC family protein [Sporichthyaceae bacterium]
MALATYKDLCIDAAEESRLATFYAEVLGLTDNRHDGLVGPTPQHTVWINQVPEPKTAKNRVHLDVHTRAVADLVALGATIVPDQAPLRWTVLRDPEGQEICAFVRAEIAAYRLYEIVVDAIDPAPIARWWGEVLGVDVQSDSFDTAIHGPTLRSYSWLEPVPGAPFDALVFVPVPEPKSVKNRVHWDVIGDTDELVEAGARLLLPKGEDCRWDVLADPDGNEFCVFAQ